jgi:hypothetical protein
MLSGRVQAGLPPIKFPDFTYEMENRTLNFIEMVGELNSGVIVVPIVAIIANVAIGKAFGNYIENLDWVRHGNMITDLQSNE